MTIESHVRPPEERRPPLRLIALPQYRDFRAALGDAPQTEAIAAAIEACAAAHPLAGQAVPGTVVRILRANRYGGYPPLRLYYSIAGAAVHLLRIEHYDEMEP